MTTESWVLPTASGEDVESRVPREGRPTPTEGRPVETTLTSSVGRRYPDGEKAELHQSPKEGKRRTPPLPSESGRQRKHKKRERSSSVDCGKERREGKRYLNVPQRPPSHTSSHLASSTGTEG